MKRPKYTRARLWRARQRTGRYNTVPTGDKNLRGRGPAKNLLQDHHYPFFFCPNLHISNVFSCIPAPALDLLAMPIECLANCCCIPCICPCLTGGEGACCCAFPCCPADGCVVLPCLPCITCLVWSHDHQSSTARPTWQNNKYLPLDLVLEESHDSEVAQKQQPTNKKME